MYYNALLNDKNDIKDFNKSSTAGITERYISIMQAAFENYGEAAVRSLFEKVKTDGITEHGFPRLTADLVILICHGRNCNLADLASLMLEFCCLRIPESHKAGNDFSVKELIFALIEAEKCQFFDDSLIKRCKEALSAFNPYSGYDRVCSVPEDKINNWAAYNCASEYMREKIGLCNSEDFLDLQLPSQIREFDENGMYKDPHNPMLYDLATRVQMAIILWVGYDGKYRQRLEEILQKSEELTLKMLSVNGEIPFGGRSNQFLFNEAYYAAICEYYAAYEASKGNISLALRFRQAANLATESIEKAVSSKNFCHVRNYYPKDSGLGCENYAYFDKYMISLASFIYIAYLFSKDTVLSDISSDTYNSGVCEDKKYKDNKYIAFTSDDFHKLFVRNGKLFLEFDLRADQRYDASGLGRVHCQGVPSPLCLSVPFPSGEAKYRTPIPNEYALCLCGGKDKYDGACREYTVETSGTSAAGSDSLIVVLKPKSGGWTEKYLISNDYLDIFCTADGENSMVYNIPVFCFDGCNNTEINSGIEKDELNGNRYFIDVSYKGYVCRYLSDSEFIDCGQEFSNRNGVYKRMTIDGKNIRLRISFDQK